MPSGEQAPRAEPPPPRPPPSLRGLLWLAPAPALGAFLLRAASDNLHSAEESTAGDRILLGLRTFWGEGPAWIDGVRQPLRWSPDPNFPLGTGLLFAVPHAYGWDPELFTRNLSLLAAVLASLAAAHLAHRLWGGAAALAGLALWGVPAFLRGAVVTGEETITTLFLLLGVLGLTGPRTARSVLPAALCFGATAAFRLDFLPVAAGAALLGALTVGGRLGLLWALLTGLPAAMHLVIASIVGGRWFGFAATAHHQAQAMSRSWLDWSPLALPRALLDQLGLPMLAVAGWGAFVALRRGPPAQVFLAVTGALLLLDELLVVTGVMQARFARYTVPLQCLLVIVATAAVGARPPRERRLLSVGALLVAVLLALWLMRGAVAGVRVAASARHPAGLRQVAAWLAVHDGQGPVLTSGMHPELAVWSGLGSAAIHPAGPVAHRGELQDRLLQTRATTLVLMPGDDATRAAEGGVEGCDPLAVFGVVRVLRCGAGAE